MDVVTWNDVIMNIINMLFKLLIMAVIPYLATLVRAKTKNDIQKKYLDLAEQFIKDAVDQVQQTYVSNMKAENLFDEKAQKEAFDMVKNNVLSMMNSRMMDIVMEAVGDFDEFIRNKIEAEVLAIKQNTPVVLDGIVSEAVE